MSSSQSLGVRNAIISVFLVGSEAYSTTNVLVTRAGLSYSQGDVFVISGARLNGASPTNDLTFTVLTVTENGGIVTYSLQGDGVGTGENPIIINLPSSQLGLNYYYTRDASDITRNIKQRIIYNEKRVNSPINAGKRGSLVFGRPGVNPGAENHIPAGNAGVAWIPYSNEYRLSYLFGKLKCGACPGGGAFNLNGPIQRS